MSLGRLRIRWFLCLLPLQAYAACGGSSSPASGTDTAAPADGGSGPIVTPEGIIRGPTSIDFDPAGKGDPISLAWDDAQATLYIADNQANQLWKWTDKDGFAKLATLPDDPAATAAGQTNLGQIVLLPDGIIAVPRFGFGQHGAIVYVNPSTGESGSVPGIAPTRQRVALTATGNGNNLWGAYFFKANTAGSDDAGVVTKISNFADELDWASGFQKPVSVVVLGDKLIVSDQGRSMLYAVPLTGQPTAPYDVYAAVPSPDTLVLGPNGTMVTGQFRPLADGGPLQLRQVFADGGFQVIAGDTPFTKPQGIVYDSTNKRLFVADSNGTTVRTLKILPLE